MEHVSDDENMMDEDDEFDEAEDSRNVGLHSGTLKREVSGHHETSQSESAHTASRMARKEEGRSRAPTWYRINPNTCDALVI
jgi:hypothetical protein